MSAAISTARRIVDQLLHDPRSIVLMLAAPGLLMVLFRLVYDGQPALFDRIGPQFLGIFPFTTMFLLTSVTMVRERTSGTLERLLTTPIRRAELIGGYALAFGLMAGAQTAVTAVVALGPLGLDVKTPWVIVVFALADALLGSTLGLVMSTFATSEFQAAQFMPIVVFPQLLLCGLLTPRAELMTGLRWLSDVMPLSYATDAFTDAARVRGMTAGMWSDLSVLLGALAVCVVLATASLRRRTP